jgi:PhnB protein
MPKRKTSGKDSKKIKAKPKKIPKSKASRPAKTSRPKTAKLKPVPDEFGTVTPYLVVRGGGEALEFYKKAFGATELSRQTTPDGKLIHGRMKIGDSIVMMSDEFPGGGASSPATLGSTSVTLHIYVDDVDNIWERALAAGARIAMPLDNQFWGERYGQLVDPFGHRWSISMQIRMDPEEMELKRKAAMELFSQSDPHGVNQGSDSELTPEQSASAAGVG